ncbi:hypothetical protein GSI_01082 [Ganoderma sinense ZZ0214-1]|uniref:Cytochrome c oxidase assembly factor 3 n=1 Tax=Ganoderma sinense ZZ0214-1 TaxID=1077348 RepID=A0A2G8SUY9_9APHY|nr:hypothetical protein GSI_01082 [Ganoderma sinense ZZ0214-1]
MTDQYVDPKYARASYRPQNIMSPGLKRAREPFKLRNTLTGVVLAGFAVGVWAYSIGAVKQDDFGDVDEEARALMAGSGLQNSMNGVAEGKTADVAKTSPVVAPATTVAEPPSLPTPVSGTRRGILPPLLERRFPGLLDPQTGTLVWNAPPVDNVGKLRMAGGTKRVV